MRIRFASAVAGLALLAGLAGCGGSNSRTLTLQQVKTAFAAEGTYLIGSSFDPCASILKGSRLCRNGHVSQGVVLLVDARSLGNEASQLSEVIVFGTVSAARAQIPSGSLPASETSTRVANVVVDYFPAGAGARAVEATLGRLRKLG